MIKKTLAAENNDLCSHINIGTGKGCTIRELSQMMAEVVGNKGKIIFDESRPNGMPQKLLNVLKLNDLCWKAKISLLEGLKMTYKEYLKTGVFC